MNLKQTIESDIKTAMLAKDTNRLKALRSIKALIQTAETEKGKAGELTKEREMEVLKRAAKQRKESADVYATNGRQELADIELAELAVIENYLPKQMSDVEIASAVKEIVAQTGANSIKQMGLVMKEFNSKFPGQDGRSVSIAIKLTLLM